MHITFTTANNNNSNNNNKYSLTYDLARKPFQQWLLAWWLFVVSFIEIPALHVTTEISRHAEYVLTDGSRPGGQPVNIMPLPFVSK